MSQNKRVLLSLAFEQRYISLCGQALAALALAVRQRQALNKALIFWGGNASQRCFLRWRRYVAHRLDCAAMDQEVRSNHNQQCRDTCLGFGSLHS